MKIKDIKIVLGGDLGQTTKMPGASFGLLTDACPTGAALQNVKGSVCEKCYAARLEKIRPNVRKGHATRTDAVKRATRSAEGMHDWITAMTDLIDHRYKDKASHECYFRWHDSGDLQDYNHLQMIVEVAKQTPKIFHWLPTKEKKLVKKFLSRHGNFPDNLIVRVSSAMIDAPPLRNVLHTSTVHYMKDAHGHVCPAYLQGGECGECRACWSKEVANVSYKKH